MISGYLPSGPPRVGAWIIRHAPVPLQKYLRLLRIDLDAGWWLLLFPCWWGLSLGSEGTVPNLWYVALFFVGAFLMEGAASVINDLTDANFDAKVTRTANRPLASGEVTRVQAVILLLVTLLASLGVLLAFQNTLMVILSFALVPMVFIYPWMKRVTYWPQAFLGMTVMFTVVIGWVAARGSIDTAPILMYLGCIFLHIHFDTIYAHQDREDDIAIGVKSSALALGDKTKTVLLAFDLCVVALIGAAGIMAGLGWGFWPVLGLVALHFVWQLKTLDINSPVICGRLFDSAWSMGWLILAAIICGQLTR
ncbi:4-hydroxybenzoate octaprenyltransferase [Phaeovibrio sulfidiphilus]|uniref:4-hydroxybenzoate octaprenyltransferase n=1 Tax=Phaeovibrio sulfidiphilus TaxID=1220600 RepID=A0A8J6YMD0_9PROT|nr:4-hydroxybenzoate octaprenyltransferase [Phaeovibrio sulfidiphilus]MBE1236504.1 4-hydroxybenzoate octaprenyltransferase [Phaeovibrio sulfidiphilus]